jgi:AraC family transcriptional regulator, regulatory protein of adaptative response / methylated-DNA-[protein]-cysteine methyltransferase
VNDYDRIASIIEFLDERHTEQPPLAQLAGHAGLSPFHFHRLFSAWAGVTPKDFLQCLTVTHARNLLRKGETVLDAALDAGLSGPGRLHDLCVTLEAASPGEIKSGGRGFVIRFGFAETPFGTWMAAENARGICHISFVENASAGIALEALAESWPRAELKRDDSVAVGLAAKVFTRTGAGAQRLRAFVRGTEFQVRVWRALLEVPPGVLVSYGFLARFAGCAGAARAVGSAIGRNPLAYLIPCHRVIRETGIVQGYRWGDTRKRALLGWESTRLDHEPARARDREEVFVSGYTSGTCIGA